MLSKRSFAVGAVVFVLAALLVHGYVDATAMPPKIMRCGWVTGIRPEKIAEYKKLHARAWPKILDQIRKSNIRNYSIYLKEISRGKWYLFSYCEYVGKDFKADMAKMAKDPTTQRWWKLTDPCQIPIPTRKKGEGIWADMEEVFHTD